MAKLRARHRQIGLLPAKRSKRQPSILELHPGQSRQTLDELRQLHARRIRFIPSFIIAGVGWQRCYCWDSRLLKLIRYVSPNRLRDFLESASIAAIDAEEVPNTGVGLVRHFGQPTHHRSAVPMKHKWAFKNCMIVQSISGDVA